MKMRGFQYSWSNRGVAVVSAALIFLGASPAATADGVLPVRIHDGEHGATCDYFDTAMRLSWIRKGGDWVDADGILHGAKSYASAFVPSVHNPVAVELDVTQLLQDMTRKGLYAGIVVSGAGGGEVVIAAREHKDPAMHPELFLTTAAGTITRLVPRADTYLNCTTNRSLGMQETVRASADQLILLDFDLAGVEFGDVAHATLRLHPTGLYGSRAVLSVYPLAGRAVKPAPAARAGLAASVSETELGRHPAVLFAEGFERRTWDKAWSILGPNSKVERVSAGAGFEALQGYALKVTIPEGKKLGLDLRYRFHDQLGKEPEEVYLRYYVRFPDEWETPVDGGKLPGLSGTYGRAGWGGRTPDGFNGWNMRMIFLRQPPAGHPLRQAVGIGTEMSVPEVPGVQTEGLFTWADGHAGVLYKNRWYCIEQHVRLNTPGKNDGVIRGWVDGKLAFERTDIIYRHTNSLKIEEVWMNVYHGGGEPTPRDIPLYIDNVVVATEYIGPMKHRPAR